MQCFCTMLTEIYPLKHSGYVWVECNFTLTIPLTHPITFSVPLQWRVSQAFRNQLSFNVPFYHFHQCLMNCLTLQMNFLQCMRKYEIKMQPLPTYKQSNEKVLMLHIYRIITWRIKTKMVKYVHNNDSHLCSSVYISTRILNISSNQILLSLWTHNTHTNDRQFQ